LFIDIGRICCCCCWMSRCHANGWPTQRASVCNGFALGDAKHARTLADIRTDAQTDIGDGNETALVERRDGDKAVLWLLNAARLSVRLSIVPVAEECYIALERRRCHHIALSLPGDVTCQPHLGCTLSPFYDLFSHVCLRHYGSLSVSSSHWPIVLTN